MKTKIIYSKSNEEIIVDSKYYDFLNRFTWSISKTPTNKYAVTTIDGIQISIHRLIVNPKQCLVVDHKDQNGLNNQENNLRAVPRSHNSANRRKTKHRRGNYIGVIQRKTKYGAIKYIAVTYVKGVPEYHGTFSTEKEAAIARDEAANKIWSGCAYLNFPKKE